MKRIIAFILLGCMCVGFASCEGKTVDSTTAQTTTATIATTAATEATTAATEATTEITTAATTEATTAVTPGDDPAVTYYDTEYLTVGDYVTVVYNTACADIKYEVKAGVGSKQTVTLTATMRDTFIFDGWSEKNAIVNGSKAVSNELTYTFTASEPIDVYLNASYTVKYNLNGGDIKGDTSDYVVTTPATMYKTVHTQIANGMIKRDGYTLIEYNTAADGTGDGVSPCSRISMNDKGDITLYCIWEKQNDEGDFTVSGDTITKYVGSSANVVIPDKIGGTVITTVAKNAFAGTSVERVVFTRNIKTIKEGAFHDCKALTSIVLFDSVSYIKDDSFVGCENLSHVQINGTMACVSKFWPNNMSSLKMDRLIWAKDKKKIILIGGSGTHYGYYSEIIDDALNNDYTIVNIGMNANINIAMYFEMASAYYVEGDIILWAPEFGTQMFGGLNSSYTWKFIYDNYDIFRYVNFSNYTGFFDSMVGSLSEVKGYITGIEEFSTYHGTTKYCDGINTTSKSHGLQYYPNAEQYIRVGEYLSSVIEDYNLKGGKVYYTFAPMDEACDSLTPESLAEFGTQIAEAFHVTVITPGELSLFPGDYFADSNWHLFGFAAKERTTRLVPYLVKQINADYGTNY